MPLGTSFLKTMMPTNVPSQGMSLLATMIFVDELYSYIH